MRARLAIAAALVLLPTSNAFTQEQTNFSADDLLVKHPTPLPPTALKLLARDDFVMNTMQSEQIVAVPPAWFIASTVHLGSPNEKDLVVMGLGPLVGANVDTFWVLRPVGNDYQLMVKGASCLGLEIRNTRTRGYRDIELFSATAVEVSRTILKFDGREYRTVSSHRKSIGGNP